MTSTANDTIAAIATAHGVGAICIIRISGACALSIASTLSGRDLKPRYATLVNLTSLSGEPLDEAIAIYFKAPNSFTGEDVVELQTHGGIVVAQMVLSEILASGARLATAGEFSKRAFLNGKIDLAKAEAIEAIINSRSESAAKILARSLRGELGDFVDELRTELVRTLAYCETAIDYADDDLPDDILDSTHKMLSQNHQKLQKIVSISQSRRGLIDGFRIAIIGKPNVGKSSLLNSLLHYERAIISDEAGTTRDRIEESIKIGTHLVKIIDTAGIRSGAGFVESKGIEYSVAAASEADIIVCVFDGSRVSDGEDLEILKLCEKHADKKIIYAINKSDLEFKFDIDLPEPVQISRYDTTGLEQILQDYLDSLDTTSLMLSSMRQIECCVAADEALVRADDLLYQGELELFAYELNKAILQLSSITKPFSTNEILDEMFSNFCLGK